MALLKKATENDLDTIYNFLYELAQYEKVQDSLVVTKRKLQEWFFEKNVMEAYFAVNEEGEKVGIATIYYTYSTFSGKRNVFIEDLFVKPSCRGNGYGKFLITELQKKVREQNDGKLVWECLEWNTPSQKFYRSLGAETDDEWIKFQLK